MKITTRLALGFGLLLVLMVGTVAWQLSTIRALQSTTSELARTSLEAARVSIRLNQAFDGVQEFSAKAVLLGDEGYYSQWETWEEAVEAELGRLEAIELNGAAAAERSRIVTGWEEYLAEAATLADLGTATNPDAGAPLPEASVLALDSDALDAVAARITSLRSRTDDLITLNEEAVASRAEASDQAALRARTLSQWAALTGVGLAALIWLFLWWSISRPLRRLTTGTREIARGNFEHRLPARGSDELSGLAGDFNDMARRLGELDELKQDFVSHVSHELKSPVAAIHETIRALLDEVPGPINDRQARLLHLSSRSTDRLSTMIGNLLAASRLEAGGDVWDPVRHDVEGILRSVLSEVEPVAAERDVRVGLTLRTSETLALCDAAGLRDVITNLVTNAIRFSGSGKRVRLTLGHFGDRPPGLPDSEVEALGDQEGPFLLLSVEDEGPGVPEEHREAIFEKFHQVQGPDRRLDGQGVGLGLAISRRVVRAHQGAIWVEGGGPSADETTGSGAPRGPGAIFRVLLPVTPRRWADAEPGEGTTG